MIEEVDFGAGYAEVVQHFEKFFARFRSAEILAVLPEPHANSLLPGIIDHFFSLLGRPFAPEAFDDVVFESQLACHACEFLHAIYAFGTAIHIAPNSAAGFDPRSMNPFSEKSLVRGRAEIG